MPEREPAAESPVTAARHEHIPRPTSDADPGTSLPTGFCVQLSEHTVVCDEGRSLLVGDRGAVLYLKPAALALMKGRTLRAHSPGSKRLARLLLNQGLANPYLEPAAEPALRSATLIIPTLDRSEAVAEMLLALRGYLPHTPILVVDDGSTAPHRQRLIDTCQQVHADIVHHTSTLGPAAARNTGWRSARTKYVAFLDSDVTPTRDFLALLLAHFCDPHVVAVAPRVRTQVALNAPWLQHYDAAHSSLDMGAHPALVGPGSRVPYVPTAALVIRRDVLMRPFDEALHSGEDVDLIWRLIDAGWSVRYEPRSEVLHTPRDNASRWLQRQAFYGTSAAQLAQRHPDKIAPLQLNAEQAAFVAALLLQRRWSLVAAAGIWMAALVRLRYRLAHSGRPWATARMLNTMASRNALDQSSQALLRHYWPLTLLLAIVSGRVRRAACLAIAASAIAQRQDHDASSIKINRNLLWRFILMRRAHDVAYGSGLWWGVLRSIIREGHANSAGALIPRWIRYPR